MASASATPEPLVERGVLEDEDTGSVLAGVSVSLDADGLPAGAFSTLSFELCELGGGDEATRRGMVAVGSQEGASSATVPCPREGT